MMIMEIKDRIPTVTGNAASTSRKTVAAHLNCNYVDFATFQGSPVWCRPSEKSSIESYWDGKYTAPEEHFT